MSECVQPQAMIDGTGPSSVCMDEHGTHKFGQASNVLFSCTILEVGIDTAKGKLLPLVAHCFPKEVVCKDAIVSNVSFTHNTKCCCMFLKGFLCFNGFFAEAVFCKCMNPHPEHWSANVVVQ